uniref:Nucleoside diphosphate kinase n=1 Tax=Gadus morhua TaxID=8049 RepID=A0A8C4Z974_GADMO
MFPTPSPAIKAIVTRHQVFFSRQPQQTLLVPTPESTRIMSDTERTFIAVKPDGVQRGLVGDIIKRFEQKGFKLVAMKMTTAKVELLQQHYADLKERPFFPSLVKYMSSGPVVAMVWEGLNAVKTGRVMLGETNPADSKPGTIRGDYCIQVGKNIIHGSDSVESAKHEISLWFKDDQCLCPFGVPPVYPRRADGGSVKASPPPPPPHPLPPSRTTLPINQWLVYTRYVSAENKTLKIV